ncbi:acyl-CoA thioester hydrolase, YbgC/YbaW family [Owenweeksia hongkongensis DSM 17368]|uniref:Acyl-CoA thioester hydrolase, YbgC/YbaW family n=1 Tax=Owenweeksia hongkongensis (strain DSM 17368 / CIP 108786 / JCM 12287 / NRRL B-23963 / UST20020801) TaxID=926562 RepID=G8R3C9_OWEHD|nr:thioesterase family protein [Owenweeksia hongkongensis]AEV31950.1 acyl-CoA thioester hydrolase, YbgC/YbaW family [Owenweeksia hongkongensis DSM 17368]
MFENTTSLRTRYAETDQMGVVYYGNYPQYFEVGRVETLRQLGVTYRNMEEDGIMLPVLKLEIKYLKSAMYDDELRIKTFLREIPNTRITFHHEIYNSAGELLTVGLVQLVFVNAETRRPMRCPQYVVDKLEPYFKEA